MLQPGSAAGAVGMSGIEVGGSVGASFLVVPAGSDHDSVMRQQAMCRPKEQIAGVCTAFFQGLRKDKPPSGYGVDELTDAMAKCDFVSLRRRGFLAAAASPTTGRSARIRRAQPASGGGYSDRT